MTQIRKFYITGEGIGGPTSSLGKATEKEQTALMQLINWLKEEKKGFIRNRYG